MGFTMILTLLSGVALFLYGMTLMGEGLKKVAGNRLESVLYKLTNTPIKGVLLGTLVTAVIQSSSATTVMVVGFVNSGMMKVSQAIGIIMGANIGTSATGWILCLSYVEGSDGIAKLLSTATISAIVAIIGIVLRMFSKKHSLRYLGEIMLGFSILMFGMQTMSGAVAPLKSDPAFVKLLTMFSHPVMGILVGILFTAVLQSASAAVGIMQALSVTGSLSFATALPITMGIGVGAAMPVLLSSIGTNKDGKRTALIYLLNDLFGMLFWSVTFYSLHAIFDFAIMDATMTPVGIAIMNTGFRILTILVLLPCIKWIEKSVYWIVKDTDEDRMERESFSLLETRFLHSPEIALEQVYKAVMEIARKVRKNVNRSGQLLWQYDVKNHNKLKERNEGIIRYHEKLGVYLAEIAELELTETQVSDLVHDWKMLSYLERINAHSLQLGELAYQIMDWKSGFSEEAEEDLRMIEDKMRELFNLVWTAFEERGQQDCVRITNQFEEIHEFADQIRTRHLERLRIGVCGVKQGVVFEAILGEIERTCVYGNKLARYISK